MWDRREEMNLILYMVQGGGHHILINTGPPQDLTRLNQAWLQYSGFPEAQISRQDWIEDLLGETPSVGRRRCLLMFPTLTPTQVALAWPLQRSLNILLRLCGTATFSGNDCGRSTRLAVQKNRTRVERGCGFAGASIRHPAFTKPQTTSHQYSFIETCIRRAEFDCVCHLPKLLF